jgi:hypothetical protein
MLVRINDYVVHMPDPVTLALGVAIGKLLLRWADLNDTADALEDAHAGFGALRLLSSKKATDPVSVAITQMLQERLTAVADQARRGQMRIAVLNVADLLTGLTDDDIRIAAQHPQGFPDYLARGPGQGLLRQTEAALTPFTREVMHVGAEVFAELAPRSGRFAGAALLRLLDQVDTTAGGVAELHDEIAAVRAELAEATISVSARVDAVHTKVDRLLEVVDRDGTTHLAVGASVRITREGTPIGPPITDWDPAALGVHASITVCDEATLTPYITRTHDLRLRELLASFDQAIWGRRMVVVEGNSCTGKTRSLYEAVREVLPEWQLVAPTSSTHLVQVLTAGVPAGTVVWLDELQKKLTKTSEGITAAQGISALLDAHHVGPILFAGTIWPDNLAALSRRPEPHESTAGADCVPALLDAAFVVTVPDAFIDTELADAPADPRLRVAINTATQTSRPETGRKVTQVLAGGDALVRRAYPLPGSRNRREFSPAAKAVLMAAGDLRRLGLPNPLPHWVLVGAAPGYLDHPPPAGSTWLEAAMAQLTRAARLDDPLTDTHALDIHAEGVPALTPTWATDINGDPIEGYDLHDFLLQDHLARHRDSPTRQALWDALAGRTQAPEPVNHRAAAAQRRSLLPPESLGQVLQGAWTRGMYRQSLEIFSAHLEADPDCSRSLSWLAQSAAFRQSILPVGDENIQACEALQAFRGLLTPEALERVFVYDRILLFPDTAHGEDLDREIGEVDGSRWQAIGNASWLGELAAYGNTDALHALEVLANRNDVGRFIRRVSRDLGGGHSYTGDDIAIGISEWAHRDWWFPRRYDSDYDEIASHWHWALGRRAGSADLQAFRALWQEARYYSSAGVTLVKLLVRCALEGKMIAGKNPAFFLSAIVGPVEVDLAEARATTAPIVAEWDRDVKEQIALEDEAKQRESTLGRGGAAPEAPDFRAVITESMLMEIRRGQDLRDLERHILRSWYEVNITQDVDEPLDIDEVIDIRSVCGATAAWCLWSLLGSAPNWDGEIWDSLREAAEHSALDDVVLVSALANSGQTRTREEIEDRAGAVGGSARHAVVERALFDCMRGRYQTAIGNWHVLTENQVWTSRVIGVLSSRAVDGDLGARQALGRLAVFPERAAPRPEGLAGLPSPFVTQEPETPASQAASAVLLWRAIDGDSLAMEELDRKATSLESARRCLAQLLTRWAREPDGSDARGQLRARAEHDPVAWDGYASVLLDLYAAGDSSALPDLLILGSLATFTRLEELISLLISQGKIGHGDALATLQRLVHSGLPSAAPALLEIYRDQCRSVSPSSKGGEQAGLVGLTCQAKPDMDDTHHGA